MHRSQIKKSKSKSSKPITLHSTPRTTKIITKKPLRTTRRQFGTNDTNDDNDFEFDELPPVKPTTRTRPPTSIPKSQPSTTTKPTTGSTFLKPDGITAQIMDNTEMGGNDNMALTSGGGIARKMGQQPHMSLDNATYNKKAIILNNLDEDISSSTLSQIGTINPELQALLDHKTPLTPLSNELRQQIVVRGPLSVAEYMQFCLGHPQYGYYMQRNAIGKKGDFVTSPEISPLFSEMIGIWGVSTWMRLGRPNKIQIVELGPGRGTLMKDFLATAERFPEFYNAISVHMVENSGAMRKLQRQSLGVELDLEMMKFHPSNMETDLARDDHIYDGAGVEIVTSYKNNQNNTKQHTHGPQEGITSNEYEHQQEQALGDMTALLAESTDLKTEINQYITMMKQQQGIGENDEYKLDMNALPSDLVAKIKKLENSFGTKVQKANELLGLTNDTTNNTQNTPKLNQTDINDKKDFLQSFMKMSTGQFTPQDFNKLFLSHLRDTKAAKANGLFADENDDNDPYDDESGWIWTEQASQETKTKLQTLYDEESQLQRELTMLLPKIHIPSHLSQQQQQQRLEQHNLHIIKLLENDPQLNEKITTISTRLEGILNDIKHIKDNMYGHKVYNKNAHRFNRYMASPVVVGTSKTKFDLLRSTQNRLSSLDGFSGDGNEVDENGNEIIDTQIIQPNTTSKISKTTFDSNDLEQSTQEVVKKIKLQRDKLKNELPISWHWTLLDVPSSAPCIILAHEFFDALPVHQFQYTQRGWREILVDVDESFETPHHFKYVLAPTPTPASVSILQPTLLQPETMESGEVKLDTPLFQHNDGHQHIKYAPKTSQILQTAGSAHQQNTQTIRSTNEKAILTKQSLDQAAIAAKMAQDKGTVASGILVGADGQPLTSSSSTTSKSTQIIENEIKALSLSESLGNLSNPMVSPDDLKSISTTKLTSTIVGLDNSTLASTSIQSPTDEANIQALDARFKRNKSSIKLTNTEEDYNALHGVDQSFESDQLTKDATTMGSLQNSPHIRQKLQSGNKIGDTYEASPACLLWSEQIALRLMKNGGAALMIDYGDNDLGHLTQNDMIPNFENENINAYAIDTRRGHAFRHLSLQGIKAHQHADVLQEPGLVDLSAHVNFAALGAAMKKTEQLITTLLHRPKDSSDYRRALDMLRLNKKSRQIDNAIDPDTFTPHTLNITRAITQGALLQQLGLEERFERLLKSCKNELEKANLFESVNRLVDPEQMGELFKAMTVYTSPMKRPPVGWDEHITQKEFQADAKYDDLQRVKAIQKEQEEIEQAEAEYQERNRMLNDLRMKSTERYNVENELEKRLQKELSIQNGARTNDGFINEIGSTQNSSDAAKALEKLKQDRENELEKGFYVVDRNKYGMD